MDRCSPIKTFQELVDQFLEKAPCQNQLATAMVRNAWKKMMPKMIVERTEQIYIQNKQLFIRTNSPSLKQELQFSKDKVEQMLRTHVPGSHFEHIVFL